MVGVGAAELVVGDAEAVVSLPVWWEVLESSLSAAALPLLLFDFLVPWVILHVSRVDLCSCYIPNAKTDCQCDDEEGGDAKPDPKPLARLARLVLHSPGRFLIGKSSFTSSSGLSNGNGASRLVVIIRVVPAGFAVAEMTWATRECGTWVALEVSTCHRICHKARTSLAKAALLPQLERGPP